MIIKKEFTVVNNIPQKAGIQVIQVMTSTQIFEHCSNARNIVANLNFVAYTTRKTFLKSLKILQKLILLVLNSL
jgi:hypothetical protein